MKSMYSIAIPNDPVNTQHIDTSSNVEAHTYEFKPKSKANNKVSNMKVIFLCAVHISVAATVTSHGLSTLGFREIKI